MFSTRIIKKNIKSYYVPGNEIRNLILLAKLLKTTVE
jgi:hypothetical protein